MKRSYSPILWGVGLLFLDKLDHEKSLKDVSNITSMSTFLGHFIGWEVLFDGGRLMGVHFMKIRSSNSPQIIF